MAVLIMLFLGRCRDRYVVPRGVHSAAQTAVQEKGYRQHACLSALSFFVAPPQNYGLCTFSCKRMAKKKQNILLIWRVNLERVCRDTDGFTDFNIFRTRTTVVPPKCALAKRQSHSVSLPRRCFRSVSWQQLSTVVLAHCKDTRLSLAYCPVPLNWKQRIDRCYCFSNDCYC
ncbi:hypothetical protein BJV82DRAFT_188095 [Fennellomyces sp. T-0311]|nr:hypothetical protein BJV82DRAFT_188095 [Fennellomyces sp. T-0311]